MTLNNHASAAIQIVLAVGDAIRELREVPAGVLYARLMGHMSLDTFNNVVEHLVRAKVVARDRSHLLRWIGPEPETR